jgi:hypothetical protein
MAWRGLGSSTLALWRSRGLDVGTRLHILLVFVFFGGVAVLHIVTPSMMTVGTFDVASTVSRNVTTMPGNLTGIRIVDQLAVNALDAMPYLYSQLGSKAGLPDGVNGS